jgi:radical SAM peptide maturase (CXXX-repeat target family)
MVINHHTYGIVLDMIGGEPFMNVDVMDFIVDYFIQQCYERDHIWLTNFRVGISTNGLLYFEPKVQAFLNKYASFISMNVTIDGPKQVHDACRIDLNGQGSFDRAIAAWEHWFKTIGTNPMDTKVTIAPENLLYIEDVFDFFLSRGCKTIHANPVFEHKWTVEEAQDYYMILLKLATKLLMVEGASSSLFSEYKGKPLLSTDTQNWCGGTGAMLAFDPQGRAYPCLRYMSSSLGPERAPIIIGDTNGVYNKPEYKKFYDDMQKVTRQSQSTDECINCPIASGCAWCFPAGTKINTPNGLKNIEDLHIYDYVIDMNGDTQMITANTGRLANDLVTVRATGFMPINVTSEHPFYCQPVVKRVNNRPVYGEPQWIAAKDLKTSDRIALFIPQLGDKEVNPCFAYVIGRYIGDGWKTKSNRIIHPYRYYICTAFDEQEEFESFLNQSGIKYTKTKNRTVEEYNLNITDNGYMVKLLDDCGENAKTKHIPREVWSWNKKSVEALLKGYFDADGSIQDDVQRFTSVSYELILNICELVRAVYHKAPNITFRKSPGKTIIEGREVNNSDSYEGRFLLVEPKKHFYEYDEKNNIIWTNIKSGPEPLKEVYVYNLTVENTHSYIANGAIVHNCSAWNY